MLREPFNAPPRRSFTLIEVIVVMAIMAIVMGVSVYQFRRGEARQDIRAAADDIKAAWAEMQVRALAGSPTPNGSTVRGYTLDGEVVIPAAGWPTTGYGLLLYGTAVSSHAIYEAIIIEDDSEPLSDEVAELTGGAFLPPGVVPGDDVLGEPFALIGCAVTPPFRTFYRCFVPLPDYSPVLPQGTYIDKASIKVAPSTTAADGRYDFTPFVLENGPSFSFHDTFNFDTCRAEVWPGIPEPAIEQMRKYLFLAIQPPQPKYYINGRPGCQVVRFAVRSTLNQSASATWLQFDVRTGRISTANEETGLPDRP